SARRLNECPVPIARTRLVADTIAWTSSTELGRRTFSAPNEILPAQFVFIRYRPVGGAGASPAIVHLGADTGVVELHDARQQLRGQGRETARGGVGACLGDVSRP